MKLQYLFMYNLKKKNCYLLNIMCDWAAHMNLLKWTVVGYWDERIYTMVL